MSASAASARSLCSASEGPPGARRAAHPAALLISSAYWAGMRAGAPVLLGAVDQLGTSRRNERSAVTTAMWRGGSGTRRRPSTSPAPVTPRPPPAAAYPSPAAQAIAVGLAAGCSSAVTQQPDEQAHRALAAGTPGRPLMLSCTERSNAGAVAPGPGDVVVGPLYIINAKDSADPNGAGSAPQHGYKYPIAVAPGEVVTMMIAASARGHVVIGNPYGPPAGVVAATYRACQPGQEQGWTLFVQGFAFTDGRTRG